MGKRVLTVLRSGGEYGPQHVQAIQRQIRKWAPTATAFACLTDTTIPGVECIPLKHDWPGWWAKLELFRWDMPEEFLYTDLDNVILGPLDDLLATNEFTADIGFSFFRITPDVNRRWVYDEFDSDPRQAMRVWSPEAHTDGKFGDAAFLRWQCGLRPAAWPADKVVNVVDMPFAGGRLACPWRVTPRVIPEGVHVMLCGGKRRRPWLSLSQQVQRAYWCR